MNTCVFAIHKESYTLIHSQIRRMLKISNTKQLQMHFITLHDGVNKSIETQILCLAQHDCLSIIFMKKFCWVFQISHCNESAVSQGLWCFFYSNLCIESKVSGNKPRKSVKVGFLRHPKGIGDRLQLLPIGLESAPIWNRVRFVNMGFPSHPNGMGDRLQLVTIGLESPPNIPHFLYS